MRVINLTKIKILGILHLRLAASCYFAISNNVNTNDNLALA